mgnify:CR=1 FL=1
MRKSKKLKRKLVTFTLAILSLTLWQSCASVEAQLPPVEFPEFPAMTETGGEVVAVPSEWIVRLAEFKIRYESLQDEWQEYKDLYSGRK